MSDTNSPAPQHIRPEGVSDATVEALGKLSEALEVVEHVRGHLYAFHRLTGTADLALGDAVDRRARMVCALAVALPGLPEPVVEVFTGRARADVALPVGLVRAVLGHGYPFLIVAAASFTALTILS